MTANTVNGSGNGARSGAQTLVLLAAPLNVNILLALAERPKQQNELRSETGFPAQTTLRAQLKRLTEIGAIEKHRRSRFPGVLEYELTLAGRDLLFVTKVLDHWLAEAPEGPLPLGSDSAKSAIKSFAEGWSTAMLRALAAGAHSLTELDRLIAPLNYPSLERRLGAMRLAGQVQAQASNGRGTPYAVTAWLRRAIAPLAAAIRWERRHQPAASPPISRLDIETAFLLTAPLLKMPEELSGVCRMAAELPNNQKRGLSGVVMAVRDGEIASCSTHLQNMADAWLLGSSGSWLNAVIERDPECLEVGGDSFLARAVLDALHQALFVKSIKAS